MPEELDEGTEFKFGQEPPSVEPPSVDGEIDVGGVVGSLRTAGCICRVLGIIVAVICIIAAGSVTKEQPTDYWGENGIDWTLVIVGAVCVAQGIFFELLLDAGAEVIRLLRKLNSK
jgi:hypothetical protein